MHSPCPKVLSPCSDGDRRHKIFGCYDDCPPMPDDYPLSKLHAGFCTCKDLVERVESLHCRPSLPMISYRSFAMKHALRLQKDEDHRFSRAMYANSRICLVTFEVVKVRSNQACSISSAFEKCLFDYDFSYYPTNYSYPSYLTISLPPRLMQRARDLSQYERHLINVLDGLIAVESLLLDSAPTDVVAQVGIDVNVPQLTEVIKLMEKLSSTFSSVLKPDVLDLMKARVISLLTSIWNIVRWTMDKMTTTDLIVNLVSAMVSLFPSEKIMKAFTYIFGSTTAQSALGISSITAVKAMFVCIFLVIASKLPGKHTIDEFIVRVRNIPQSLKSISMFYEMVEPIANECVAFVEQHVMKYDVSASRVQTIDEVTKFSERVAELVDLHKRRQINKDPAIAKEAGRLHYDAVRLLGRCVNMNYDRKSIEFLRSLLPTTYKISETALASGADMNKIRRKPIVIWLAGQSQIGKTTLIMKLIQDIEKHSSPHFRETGSLPDDWQKEIFTCCPENEYMDGYHGQRWVTLDEFNQMRDSVANPSAENFIILRAISQFPYLMHMAALYEKPNSYLSSDGFILTSNSTNIQPESIKTKEALTNRINNPYKMCVKEEYRSYFDNNKKYKLNVPKVLADFGGYTTDCYYFVQFDPYTEQERPECYTYAQFLWRVIDSYDSESRAFSGYSNFLNENRSQPLPPRGGDLYTPPESSFSDSSDEPPIRPPRKRLHPPREILSSREDHCEYLPSVVEAKEWLAQKASREESDQRSLNWWREYYKNQTPKTDFSDSPAHGFLQKEKSWWKKAPKAQVGAQKFYRIGPYEDTYGWVDSDGVVFDNPDYKETPLWAIPYELAYTFFASPFLVTEECCLRSSRFSSFVPNFIRRITCSVYNEFNTKPPGYTRTYNHSVLSSPTVEDASAAFAQGTFLSNDECVSVIRRIASFRDYVKNRLQVLSQTAQFYLPGIQCAFVSAVITGGLCYWKWQLTTKYLKSFAPPMEDPVFLPKLHAAEQCYLNGCNCSDCESVDLEQYEDDFIFWNVPCKCYVDYCNKQSIEDQQRFVAVIAQSVPPEPIEKESVKLQMKTFVAKCKCAECPLCVGEECLCKGIARARGVEIGEDDLLDRAGLYRITRERLRRFANKELQGADCSGSEKPNKPRCVIRTQTESPKDTPNKPRQIVRTQILSAQGAGYSGPESPNKPLLKVRTQSVLDVLSERKQLLQEEIALCDRALEKFENPTTQFEAVSCKHKDCDCPAKMNSAVEKVHKQYPSAPRGELPEFVRYSEASEARQKEWDEFSDLTYVQLKRKLQKMNECMGTSVGVAQANRANDLQARDLLHHRLWPNILRLYVVLPGESSNAIHRQLGHLLALGGDLFLTNHHFMSVLSLYPDADVVIRQGTIEWKRLKSVEFTSRFYRIGTKDAVVVRLEYKGNAFARISQHFISKNVSFSHETQTVCIARYSMNKQCQMYPNPITVAGARLASSRINIDVDPRVKEVIVQPISWEYDCHTLNGDCGSPVVLFNSRIPAKIVGIHNAYSDGLGTGYAVPLYADEIQDAINHFGTHSQYGWADLMPIDDTDLLRIEDGENFRVVSVQRGALPQPVKTKLRHSPIHGRLIQTATKPGYLRPFSLDGKEINPTLLSRKKWGYHLPQLDQIKVEQCDNLVSQIFCAKTVRDVHEYCVPMTTEESIVGIAGVDGMPSMNKQSSPGYPWIFSKPKGRGKTGYFGAYEWDLTTPEAQTVLDAINNMEKDIVNGVRPFVVSVDTLKDARIPVEKANAGKTRIFSAEPVDYCALHRKFFLPFTAHVMANRLFNHSAPGINATSPEFNRLATFLRSKGKKIVAADYSQFDGRIPTEAIRSYYRAACDWYSMHWDLIVECRRNVVGGRELSLDEFRDFLMKLALECTNHVHVCEKQNEQGERFLVFYVVMNGQPSGNPGTAVSNTCAGIWIVAYCWLTDVTPVMNWSLERFLEETYICCYGDDMIMNISDAVCEVFNQTTLTASMMRNFMLECTDEQKSTSQPPPYRSLAEVSFLKRRFLWNDDICMYVGALPVDLLLDISNWVRSGSQDPYVITADVLQSIAAEVALHGKEVFDREMPAIRNAFRSIAIRSGKMAFFDTYFSYLFRYRDGEGFPQAVV